MSQEPSEIFKVLGLDTRIKIIELLKAKGSLGVKDITGMLGITSAAVSQHLKILKQAGLVKCERKGYWIPYSINEEAMDNCRQVLTEVCTCGCQDTGKFREIELIKSSLESLRKYEKEIENELIIVRERIRELESAVE